METTLGHTPSSRLLPKSMPKTVFGRVKNDY
jgi:hypothetical protein